MNINVYIEIIGSFLGHPLVVSIITIALGTFFIDRINKKKEKREKHVNGAIAVAEEISDTLNNDLTCLFLQVRTQDFTILPDFVQASMLAFKNRLKYKIRIQTYFCENNIYDEYNTIIREISTIKQSIERYQKDPDAEKAYIISRISELKGIWHIDNYKIEPLKAPFDLYFSWSQVVWYKTEQFSSQLYKLALNVS